MGTLLDIRAGYQALAPPKCVKITSMRVLVIAANQEQQPDPVIPLGAAYVAAAAREAGHETRLFDLCFAGEDWHQPLRATLRAFQPRVVALSMRNVDDVRWPVARQFVDHYRAIVGVLRDGSPQATLVLGGSAFTLFPHEFMSELGADHGIIGEGEFAFQQLLVGLENGVSPAPLINPSSAARQASFDIEPALDLVCIDEYLQKGGMTNVQSKRGCAFTCSYCTYPGLEGRRVRMREPVDVVNQIESQFTQFGCDYVYFVDNVFNIPRSHAKAICHELIERQLPIRFTAQVSPAGLDFELVALMKEAGCSGIDLGTDAATDVTLKALNKSFSVADIQACSAWCHDVGLKFSHSLILGGRDETEETMQHTVATINATNPTAVIAFLGVRVYPGTPLAQWLIAEGTLQAHEITTNPLFYISPELESTLLSKAKQLNNAYRNWWFPGLESHKSRFVQRVRERGYRGPVWELMG